MGEWMDDCEERGYSADWDPGPGVRPESKPSSSSKSVEWLKKSLELEWLTGISCNTRTSDPNDLFECVPKNSLKDWLSGSSQETSESEAFVQRDGERFLHKDFLSAVKQAKTPFRLDGNDFFWDSGTNSLISPRFLWEQSSRRSQFLEQNWLSDNQGLKPILIQKENAQGVPLDDPIPFENPDFIYHESIFDYCVVMHDAAGLRRSFELQAFARAESALVTRAGVYVYVDGNYESLFRDSYLRANAYRILKDHRHPCELRCYRKKEFGTVFTAGYERLRLNFGFVPWDGVEGLLGFARLLEKSYPDSNILVGTGHPCAVSEPCFGSQLCLENVITTPFYYRQAVEYLCALADQEDLSQNSIEISGL